MANLTRRQFLAETGSCARHLALAAAVTPAFLRLEWTRRTIGAVVAAEPFGRLEAVGANVWALVSTPLGGDFTTVSNGGIIAGNDGVLVFEGLMRPAGATWLAQRAKDLTGKWPTHLLLSHYHSDHVNGLAGYGDGGPMPAIHVTPDTKARSERNQPADEARNRALGSVLTIDPAAEAKLDLGGRVVRITPRAGHTASDVVVTVDDPAIVFCGDLVWNGMFPNYVDCVPSLLAKTVRELRGPDSLLYVPGHGPLGKKADLDRYLSVLDEVERAARAAKAKGVTAAEAGGSYTLPASLGEWTLFNKRFMETAFSAWYRELGG
jgi:glyoxylase-like metal-dependent hydrolase (beta-lactamase superfamily II)